MRSFLMLIISVCVLTTSLSADPLRVVTTLSTYADIARTIGADAVEVSAIASPRFNPHFIEPKPSDVLKLKRAELFIHGGLDLEAWREALVIAAANSAVRPGAERELDVSRRIQLLEIPTAPLSRAQGDIHVFGNPHYFTAPPNGLIIARTIEAKLAELIPERKPEFEAHLVAFENALNNVIAETKVKFAPFKGRTVIAYHNEWIYLTQFLGLTLEEYLEPKPGVPPTPKHIAELQDYIREHKVTAILQAGYVPTDDSDALAERTGAKVVKLCQAVGEREECSTFTALAQFNAQQIIAALK